MLLLLLLLLLLGYNNSLGGGGRRYCGRGLLTRRPRLADHVESGRDLRGGRLQRRRVLEA